MRLQQILRDRFVTALAAVDASAADLADMVRPTQDSRFGDYQANCAMPLAKRLGQPPRTVAQQIVDHLRVEDFCHIPEIAGPGFINLRLRTDWLSQQMREIAADGRLGVEPVAVPRTILIDYSSPNVAKPMHVGHIRSTVIGDALARVLRFLGHRVITDNHLGDWGTQFGMVIYGYKNFVDAEAYARAPVAELSRLYRLVNQLIGYHEAVGRRGALQSQLETLTESVRSCRAAAEAAPAAERKKAEKALQAAERKARSAQEAWDEGEQKIAAVQADPSLSSLAEPHRDIARAVLRETAKLHEGDAENRRLWEQFLPLCQDEIQRVYQRLDIQFDHTLGESFYDEMLPGVVRQLRDQGLATDSEGAVCVFLPQFDAPMIVQKQDGAFLYATTDLATLQYRRERFHPDEVLYVVDARQSEHFTKLFAVAEAMGMTEMRLVHVSFGTVLGEDGRPFKTRSGTSVGLESLLDDAVARAHRVVCDPERVQRFDPPLSEAEMRRIAEVVGHGAIKYADLAHHRTSDYRFSLEKMVSLEGNTSAYIQYAYSRTQSILRAGGIESAEALLEKGEPIACQEPPERALVLALLRCEETLLAVHEEYAPNLLVDYLYDLAKQFAVFFESCPVLKADTPALRLQRLRLVAILGQALRRGLQLLGIDVVARM